MENSKRNISEEANDSEKTETSSKRLKGRKQHRLWKKQNLEKKLLKQQQKQSAKDAEKAALEAQQNEDGAKYTISIAVPGSILNNAQSPVLRTYLAGQIARAAAIFQVDEVVVFDDMGITRSTANKDLSEEERLDLSDIKEQCIQLGRILQYLECPQYLRKYLFPIQKHLEFAGVLNPLDSIHHFRENDTSIYREGVIANKPAKNGCSLVYVGLQKEIQIDKEIQAGVRVTVKLNSNVDGERKMKGTVVSPNCPRMESGVYWGYNVRLAHSLGSVLTECPFDGGYDLTVGTSDKGDSVENYQIPTFKHMLVVFGGLSGLEASLEADEGLRIGDIRLLFGAYLNTCPNQGSRVIRTEEALLISLAVLSSKLSVNGRTNH